jgi:hypothetical protein
MTSIGRLIAVVAAAVLVVSAAAFLFFRSSIASEGVYRVAMAVGLEAPAPERHVVPAGFQGWAVVHFAVAGAPPLREDDGSLIMEYPANGRLDTSTPAPEAQGFVQRGYFRQTAGGLVPLSRASDIWGEYSHLTVPDDRVNVAYRSSGFFVGTMTEFRATEWPAEHAAPSGGGD